MWATIQKCPETVFSVAKLRQNKKIMIIKKKPNNMGVSTKRNNWVKGMLDSKWEEEAGKRLMIILPKTSSVNECAKDDENEEEGHMKNTEKNTEKNKEKRKTSKTEEGTMYLATCTVEMDSVEDVAGSMSTMRVNAKADGLERWWWGRKGGKERWKEWNSAREILWAQREKKKAVAIPKENEIKEAKTYSARCATNQHFSIHNRFRF